MSYNNWLKVWWTNKNPRLIAHYYLEAARKLGGRDLTVTLSMFPHESARLEGVPLITQSDPGPENFGVANAHTMIRHRLDPSLSDTLQHRWMRKNHNIKSEANWSVFRRDFTPGFETLFDQGINNGWYDVNDLLEQ
jgi:hypothetical protein